MVHGVQTQAPSIIGSVGPGANQSAFIPLPGAAFGTYGTVESVVTQLFDDLGSNHALAGVALAGATTVALYHGIALAPTSAELWCNGVKLAQNAVAAGSRRFKLAWEPGRLRAWVDGAVIYDGNPAGMPAGGTACGYLQTDANPGHTHATQASWSQTVVTSGNTLGFRRCPANGSAVVNVNGGADQAVSLDVLGAGTLDLGSTSMPVRARYRVYDAPAGTGTLLADLLVPYAYGGDVLGYLPIPLTPAPAGTFLLSRRSSGLLFSDDFARADGAPGGSYVIENGVWAIVGGRLQATVQNGVETVLRLAALANRVNMHAQLDVTKSDLRVNLSPIARRAGLTFYQFDVGASNDATDPNKARLYRRTAGVYTRLAGGTLIGIVVNVVNRLTLSVLGTAQAGWVDAAAQTIAADATAANQPAGGLAFLAYGNTVAGTATMDNLVVCAERSIAVLRLPFGYKARVGALVSAASVSGDVTLDLAGTSLPAPLLELLDAGNNVVRTLAPAGGIFGGDQFLCT